MEYVRTVDLPVSSKEAFAWHERPGALDRLIPPWETVRVISRERGIGPGARTKLRQNLGPIPVTWLAEHREYDPPRHFRDVQLEGPFADWDHVHSFRDIAGGSVLEDRISYELPGGRLGRWLGARYTESQIDRMFRYRHRVTVDDLRAHARFSGRKTMRVAVTGATGLVGSALVPFLTSGGHDVYPVVRREPGEREIGWDPANGKLNAADLEGFDAVVHLAGENIAGRWTKHRKQKIRDSRVRGTELLAKALAGLERPPEVLVSASAIGIYGDRGDEMLDETSDAGQNFYLADVVQAWERATDPASEAGIRVVTARLGIVLSPKGGALKKMLPPFRMGVGGNIGNGRQYWSWVALDDVVGALHHAMLTDSLRGPVNVVAPDPPRNAEFTKVLGKVLHRPTLIPVPAFAARLGLGEMANELLLASARVSPTRLAKCGYAFRYPELEAALRHVLGRD